MEYVMEILDFQFSRKRILSIIISIIVLLYVTSVQSTSAEILFKKTSIGIEGLPPGFLFSSWTRAGLYGQNRKDLVIAGTSQGNSVIYVLRNQNGVLKVVNKISEKPLQYGEGEEVVEKKIFGFFKWKTTTTTFTFPKCDVSNLTNCDLDNDGHDEVFATGFEMCTNRMVKWENGRFLEKPLPFPNLNNPVYAWLDYNGDGWVDLFLSGNKPIDKDEYTVEEVVGRIYENQRGRLEPTDITFDIHGIDSVHVLDFDQDEKSDLFFGVLTGWNKNPHFNHIFLNRGDHFEEVKNPLGGLDTLFGMNNVKIAKLNLNGDDLDDLLVSGYWNGRFRAKSILTIPYTKHFQKINQTYYLDYDMDHMKQFPDIDGHFVVEDLDKDGDKDVFGFGIDRKLNSRIVCLERRFGSYNQIEWGSWAENQEQPLGFEYGTNIIPVDINEDGLLDFICFPNCSRKPIVSLLNISKE